MSLSTSDVHAATKNRVTECRKFPLTSIDSSLVVVDVEMQRPVLSTLCIKQGEQRADLLMVTVNHDPPLASLSSSLSNACQQKHGAYVMDQHGRGVLLKPAGSVRVVTRVRGSGSVPSAPTLTYADMCDVNLVRAYRMGVSRTQDASFRTSSTSPGELLMVWVDESAQSRREEADYAKIIERQIELIRATNQGTWTVCFACVLDTTIGTDGPLMAMMNRAGVSVYKSHQSLVDDLFGIEISTHDAKSCMNVSLTHKDDSAIRPAFHSGKMTDAYLTTVPTELQAISVTAASNPLDTDGAMIGSIQGLHISADMSDSPSTEATIVLVSDCTELRHSTNAVVFGSDRRMSDSEVLSISPVASKLPPRIDGVIGDLLLIRECDAKGDAFAECFSRLVRATAEWNAAQSADFPGMSSDDQSMVKCVVGGLFQRVCEWLHSPVMGVLRYPSLTGSDQLHLGARGCPLHPPMRERQQSLALMPQ